MSSLGGDGTEKRSLQIDDVNGFDNSITAPFLERIKEAGLTEADVDLVSLLLLPQSAQPNIYGYLYLFDGLKLYAMAARKALNDSGQNPDVLLNGNIIWNAMRKMKFLGLFCTLSFSLRRSRLLS